MANSACRFIGPERRLASIILYQTMLLAAALSGCTSVTHPKNRAPETATPLDKPTQETAPELSSDLPKRRGRSKPGTAPASDLRSVENKAPRDVNVVASADRNAGVSADRRADLPPSIPPTQEYALDLSTALRLAELENPLIAEARQRVGESLAVLQGARALLVPSLNAGFNYHAHTGNLQRSSGRILNLNEQSLYFGGGADAVAAGTVEIPAVSIYSPLTDAYFEPLAAKRNVEGARFNASATANNILREVAELYFELLAAVADLRVRHISAEQEGEVARLTQAYADAGQGRSADAHRAATELDLIEREVKQAEEGVAVASARLARRLHLDQSVRLQPVAPVIELVTLIDPAASLPTLIQGALRQRPEMAARTAAILAAEARHRQELCRPLLPTIWLGFSGGAFGGGSNLLGPELAHFGGRSDIDVQAFWTLNNLGFGNLALQKRRLAQVGEAEGERARTIAAIRAEVSEAYADVAASQRQVEITTRQLASAEEGFREDLLRIKNTVGRPIEVVNSLELLNHARVDRIRAVTDYDKAQFRLFVSLGSPPPLGASADTPLPPAPIAAPLLAGLVCPGDPGGPGRPTPAVGMRNPR